MPIALAPRPANEERRANAVISTGLIDSLEPELFQIQCDLAKDISGFEKASFSLFDYENQCEIADNGYDESQVGQKSERDEFNIRSLNIPIGQCGSVAIHLKFETSEDLKNFEDQAKEFFQI